MSSMSAVFQCLVASLDGQDPKTLRDTLDRVKNRLSQGVVVLATVRDEKVNFDCRRDG